MTYNPELTERVRKALTHVPNVTERKMFGSVGFIVNGKLCIGVGDHRDHDMMVRVGPNAYEDALKKHDANPAVMHRRENKGYIFLIKEVVKTKKDLDYWVGLALDFNKQL